MPPTLSSVKKLIPKSTAATSTPLFNVRFIALLDGNRATENRAFLGEARTAQLLRAAVDGPVQRLLGRRLDRQRRRMSTVAATDPAMVAAATIASGRPVIQSSVFSHLRSPKNSSRVPT